MTNMIKLQVKMLFKNPVMIINFIGYPIILTLIIGYLTTNIFGSGISSYEYYSNSMMIFIYMGAGILVAYSLIENEVVSGNFRAVYAPISKATIYLSQVVSANIFMLVSIVLNVLVFKYLFGVNYGGNEILIILGLLTISFLSISVGILLCGCTNNFGLINGVINMVQGALCILGGAFFSMEALGKVPALLSKLSPVKYLIDGIFLSIYEGQSKMLISIVFINIVLGLIILFIANKKFDVQKYM